MSREKRSTLRIERAYEPRADEEGRRVLVDRLWPRGIRKQALALDEWIREVAPSDDLRKWFGHDPSVWHDFQRRYRRELASGPAREAFDHLVELARRGPLTLVYGARDEEHNNAAVLAKMIGQRLSRARPEGPVAPRRSPRAGRPSARALRGKARTAAARSRGR